MKRKYFVWLKSVPGFFAQYDGKVEVLADNSEEAIQVAYRKLKAETFPDRSKDMWQVEKVERLMH